MNDEDDIIDLILSGKIEGLNEKEQNMPKILRLKIV